MKTKIATLLLAALFIGGCSSAPTKQSLASMSNMELCKRAISEGPILDTGGRVLMGVLTLGITELGEQHAGNVRDSYLEEANSRGIQNCSADSIAKVECRSLFPNSGSTQYTQCVSTATASIHQQLKTVEDDLLERRGRVYRGAANGLIQNQQQAQQQNSMTPQSMDLTGCTQLGGVTRCNGQGATTVDLTNCKMLGNVLRCNADSF